MRRLYWTAALVVAALSLAAAGKLLLTRPAAAADAAVTIDNLAFSPADITVTVGSTVTWTNAQASIPHTTSADDGSTWDSGILSTGDTFSQKFDTAGDFAYHCNVHPSMHGTVHVVQEEATAPPPAPSGASVTLDNIAFDPAEVTINVGDTVTWNHKQAGVPHTTTSDNGLWDSKVFNAGESFSFTFTSAGDFAYHCDVHPARMKGVVHVVGAPSAASVTIDNFAFAPPELVVKPGAVVTWTNTQAGVRHTVSSDDAGVFDSGALSTGDTFSFTFANVGDFAYHCNIHPRMTAIIRVTNDTVAPPPPTAAPTPPPTPAPTVAPPMPAPPPPPPTPTPVPYEPPRY